jgi:hypothetical protein
MCAAIDVQHLPGYALRLCQGEDGIDDFLGAGDAVHGRERLQKVLRAILVQRRAASSSKIKVHETAALSSASGLSWRSSDANLNVHEA